MYGKILTSDEIIERLENEEREKEEKDAEKARKAAERKAKNKATGRAKKGKGALKPIANGNEESDSDKEEI